MEPKHRWEIRKWEPKKKKPLVIQRTIKLVFFFFRCWWRILKRNKRQKYWLPNLTHQWEVKIKNKKQNKQITVGSFTKSNAISNVKNKAHSLLYFEEKKILSAPSKATSRCWKLKQLGRSVKSNAKIWRRSVLGKLTLKFRGKTRPVEMWRRDFTHHIGPEKPPVDHWYDAGQLRGNKVLEHDHPSEIELFS